MVSQNISTGVGLLNGTSRPKQSHRFLPYGADVIRTALVHDWLVTLGGAEKVLAELLALYPSPIHTLIYDQKKTASAFPPTTNIISSFLQALPLAKTWHRHYFPLYTLAIEQFDLRNYDLVISSSHAVAKGVLTHPGQLHICYCHTPARYAWDLMHQYLDELPLFQKMLAAFFLHRLRSWDITSLPRVDHFVTNSHFTRKRIRKFYNKEAHVIYPPVDVDRFVLSEKKDRYFITVSRQVSYKRVQLLVEAFAHLPHEQLIVIGDGPDLSKTKRIATKNVEFLGNQSSAVVEHYVGGAKAFLFAAEEDFGIAPVEAQATGTPVIALGKGGSLETIIEGKTGVFFHEPTVPSLLAAIQRFETLSWDPVAIRKHATSFSRARFQQEFKQFVEQKWENFHESHHPCGR